MTDNINKISQNQQIQQTSASIVNLTDEDVVKIWDAVSVFIENYMKQSKGVIIPGFGTFSFIHKRIDVGNNKYLLIQRPVFVLSEKVLQTHGLKSNHYPMNGSIPVHPLNYFYLQTQSSYTRDQIEQCVKHVLQIFNRSIAAQRNVEFTFSHIGKLQIRDGKVKMRFFKDFINAVDENAGKHIIDNMCNRPQTCDSVMSERDATRPPTSSNVVLPRLNSRVGNPSMQAIQEENHNDNEENEQTHRDETGDLKLPSLNEISEESPPIVTPHVVKTTGRNLHQESLIPIASLFSSMDLVQPSTVIKKAPTPYSPLRRVKTAVHHNEYETEQNNTNSLSSSTVIIRPPLPNENTFSTSLTTNSQQNKIKSQTSCGHYGAGHELCGVCHQRAKRNIPVYLHEEKRIGEAEEAKLLEQYQHSRDVEEQKKHEAVMKAAREERRRIAAFNLGIVEAARAKKAERPQTTDIPRSVIFRKRVKTPPSYLRQQDFARQLEHQIKSKQDEQRSEKQDKAFIERLEQIQLAESLAQEREVYLKHKRLHQEEIKSSLDNQIRNKPTNLPSGETETPYFGLNDMSPEKLQERRQHAIEIARQQKELVEQRQRRQLLKQIREQEDDLKTISAMKQDLLSDHRERYRRAIKVRRNLETDWTQATHEKHQRDDEEKMYLKGPQGMLIHEQCDEYKRCAQCQRDLNNTGKANFWKDTRYIPGTHIMV